MYLNSMGGRHATPVTEKRRESVHRKRGLKPSNNNGSTSQESQDKNIDKAKIEA